MKIFKNYHSNYTRNSFAVAMAALLWGCATPSADPQQASTPPVPPPPVQPIPFDEAFSKAANDLFSHTQLPATSDEKSTKYALVIDPLVDGVSGEQSVATHTMEARLIELIKNQYPQYAVEPFSPATVAKSPIVLVGTLLESIRKGKQKGRVKHFASVSR